MATMNPFDLLGDDDNDDPSQLIAAQQQKLPPPTSGQKKAPAQAQSVAASKMPTKPLPPAQAVREGKTEFQRDGRGGRGGGRGRAIYQDSADKENSFGSNNGFSGDYRPSGDGEGARPSERQGGYGGPRGGYRGGRRGGFSNGESADEERPRRVYERRSGTGRGSEFKCEGAGRANWGTPTDEIAPETEEPGNDVEKSIDADKQNGQDGAGDASKDPPTNEPEEKEAEDKEMTLEEYEKVLEEKRKALMALKPEERKVDLDRAFESMQMISNKKNDDDIFIKLGSEKDKKKEAGEKVKKTKSINEFLKPADGKSYNRMGGRGRGRGRGRGGYGGNYTNHAEAPSIEDVGQFPTLGAK